MQDACNSRGLNVTSIALLGTVPIVPKDVTLPHKVGYILGPILGVLFIAFFFGMMSFLAWEKHRDISKAQDVESNNPKAGNKPRRAGALGGLLGCLACQRGRGSGAAAEPAGKTASPAKGADTVSLWNQASTDR